MCPEAGCAHSVRTVRRSGIIRTSASRESRVPPEWGGRGGCTPSEAQKWLYRRSTWHILGGTACKRAAVLPYGSTRTRAYSRYVQMCMHKDAKCTNVYTKCTNGTVVQGGAVVDAGAPTRAPPDAMCTAPMTVHGQSEAAPLCGD